MRYWRFWDGWRFFPTNNEECSDGETIQYDTTEAPAHAMHTNTMALNEARKWRYTLG